MKSPIYRKGIIIRSKSHSFVVVNKKRIPVEGSYQEIIWKKG